MEGLHLATHYCHVVGISKYINYSFVIYNLPAGGSAI